MPEPLNGWLVIDKPLGLGSTQVVSAVKRALREGGYTKAKVGHGGTLDPLASGVLPIAIGEATKLAGRMLDATKDYAFTIGFGVETDTLDAEGVAVEMSDMRPTFFEVEAVLPRFTGPIEQMPPAFSALKVEGRRAYDLARAGEAFELATRSVTVHSLTPLPLWEREGPAAQRWEGEGSRANASVAHHPFARPAIEAARASPSPQSSPTRGEEVEAITILASVSKGTYIRSLARDIARALGTVGHVTMLRRTRAGPFGLDRAISLDSLRELGYGRALEQALLPIEAALDDIPALSLTPDQARLLRMGQRVIGIADASGLQLATAGSVPVALVETDGLETRVVRGFNL